MLKYTVREKRGALGRGGCTFELTEGDASASPFGPAVLLAILTTEYRCPDSLILFSRSHGYLHFVRCGRLDHHSP